MTTISPAQSQVQAALKAFLLDVLPAGWSVVEQVDNRVPEPQGKFVALNVVRFRRLRTNKSTDDDCKFTAAIAGTTMTVSAVAHGVIDVGATVFGTGVAAGTKVTALGTGTGGVGTYTVDPAQTISSRILSAGRKAIEEGVELTVQMDFHSSDVDAGDAARIVSTVLRDPYAVAFFEALADEVAPLHADDARMAVFFNEEVQAEWRWIVEAALQANQTVKVPMQYADSFDLDLVSVDADFPA